ncbi:MAG TPA: hypothetical protein VFF11_12150, partial [Candidatus Binatia bacterium]|nr:hypothetical protein [Candidatus Binatia bacterium]
MQRQVSLRGKIHYLPGRKPVVQDLELVLLQVPHEPAVFVHDGENHVDFVRSYAHGGDLFNLDFTGLLLAGRRWRSRRRGLLGRGHTAGKDQCACKKKVLFEGHKTLDALIIVGNSAVGQFEKLTHSQ